MAITRNQAVEFFRCDDLIGLGMEADTLRQDLHPEGVVTYLVDRTIHYACFCSGYCSVCDVSRPPESGRSSETAGEGHLADFNTIYARIAETAEMGGTGISLEAGGQHAGLTHAWSLDSFEDLLRGIRKRFPGMWLHCFSAPEIVRMATLAGLTVRDTISRLRDAGLDSITGSGAEILDDEVRRRTGWRTGSTEEWINVHRNAHELGMRTTATMTFGQGENWEQRVNHLEQVRRLQETTGGFAAFIPTDFRCETSDPAGGDRDQVTSVEYLKTLAISRLYLDNIENVQSGGEEQDLKVLQLGLRFGGNDAGSALGRSRVRGEEDLRRVIRDAGFQPVQRDTLYTTCFLD